MDKQKTILAALAALVGLGWLFRKGGNADATVPGFVAPTNNANAAQPVVILATGGGGGGVPGASDQTVTNPAPTGVTGASFGAGTAQQPQATSAENAEAEAAMVAFRAGQPAPAGWRYTPMGPVRI